MKHPFLTLGTLIAAATAVVFVYMFSIILDMRLELIMVLYVIATLSTLWMMIRILKDPYSTKKTFDDQFYQDRDDLRRTGTE